jgi:HD-GYP domain-containing protein (c-di-GMP phosphodiesterase class II)
MSELPAILHYAPSNATTTRVSEALSEAGMRVVRADEPTAALALLLDEPVTVLLLHGPSLTPMSERVLRQWRAQDPLLEAVGIAGDGERPESALVRMDCGAVLPSAADTGALVNAVNQAIARRETRAGMVRGDEEVASLVLQATRALVAAVEMKDVYTRGRADRVAMFAGILADEVGGLDSDRIRTAARIMDVGKTGVPEEILNKTDTLTPAEYDQVKRHPVISWEMLRHIFRDEVVLNVARHHHERWDGNGYPDGLSGVEIPLEARIVGIADTLDAITSTRAFREARLWSEAVDEIIRASGSRYDPTIVEVFERAQDRLLVGA